MPKTPDSPIAACMPCNLAMLRKGDCATVTGNYRTHLHPLALMRIAILFKNKPMINIFIADDHAMMREGLKRIIAGADDVRIVGEAADGPEVLEKVGKNSCDLLLLDMTMPGVNGLDLIKQIRKRHANLPVLVLSMHNTVKIVAAALRAGANGYLTKDSDPNCLMEIIRKIAKGGKHVDPAMAARIVFEGSDSKQPHEYLSGR